MRVAEIMTKDVQTVPPKLAAFEAWDLMRRKGIRHLVVVDAGEVKGVLSSRDTGGRLGANLRAQHTVAELMTSPVVTVSSGDTIRRAAGLMRGRTLGCLPVIDRKRLVGIITVSDLLDLLGRGVDRPNSAPRRNLHHRVPHRKTKGAFGVW